MKTYVDNGISPDYLWFDAGWYFDADNKTTPVWQKTGSWIMDTNQFPTGFKDVTEYASSVGTGSILWFEPEFIRVSLDSLVQNEGFSYDWTLGEFRSLTDPRNETGATYYVPDLSNTDYQKWLIEHVGYILDNANISMYRSDFNGSVAYVWRRADEEGRIGIAENLYVQNYLKYWDTLLQLFPGLTIDSCASGGGRNDLETMRRAAICINRTDQEYYNAEIQQSMSYSVWKWLPNIGANGSESDGIPNLYYLRTRYSMAFVIHSFGQYKINSEDMDWTLIQKAYAEWNQIKDYFSADYYPLTEWNSNNYKWIGWEYFDPDKNAGFVSMFRPVNATSAENTYKLYGLDENVTYVLTDMDTNQEVTATGKQLMEDGYTFSLPNAESSALLLIKAVG